MTPEIPMDYQRHNEFLELGHRLRRMSATSKSWLVHIAFGFAAWVCDVMRERMTRKAIT